MKTLIQSDKKAAIILIAAMLAASTPARARHHQDVSTSTVVTTQTLPSENAPVAPSSPIEQEKIVIQTVDDGGRKMQTREVAWLGLAVEESTEALSAQLGLKHGEGLTVHFLAAGSPAAKAEFQKNDVLIDLDGQMLVHPMQLRKLVQMHSDGDTIKVTFFRAGKKQTVSVKLGKTHWEEADNQVDPTATVAVESLQSRLSGLTGELNGMSDTLSRVRLSNVKMDLDASRTMEQTRKAIQDAVRRANTNRVHIFHDDQGLNELAGDGVNVDKDATIIVRNKHNSSRTVLQTDESGTYIIEAGAKTHLTARNSEGKLLFEGEIDTPAEREKIPTDVWKKVEPMYDQFTSPDGAKPKITEDNK